MRRATMAARNLVSFSTLIGPFEFERALTTRPSTGGKRTFCRESSVPLGLSRAIFWYHWPLQNQFGWQIGRPETVKWMYFKWDSYLHNFFTISDFPIQFSIFTSCRIHHVFWPWGACVLTNNFNSDLGSDKIIYLLITIYLLCLMQEKFPETSCGIEQHYLSMGKYRCSVTGLLLIMQSQLIPYTSHS